MLSFRTSLKVLKRYAPFAGGTSRHLVSPPEMRSALSPKVPSIPGASITSNAYPKVLHRDGPIDNGFALDSSFVQTYSRKDVPFGFNGLGEFVFRRTYSRIRDNGLNEEWFETVERVVNGTFTMQLEWSSSLNIPFDHQKAQEQAKEMYERIFHMKFLPPGRGLWAMGTLLTRERKLFAALNNCGFVSTENFSHSVDPSKPFCFLMDCSMLGIGIGFDTKGARGRPLHQPSNMTTPFIIWDSREGWVEALRRLINSYYLSVPSPEFDFSLIRPSGEIIHGFGGVASGPGPLMEMLDEIKRVFDGHIGAPLSVSGIVDVMNLIGKCVVAGNVRRTAEIAFGDPNEPEYLDLKNYKKNPQRMSFGWTSNNSVFAELGSKYSDICDRVRVNGEPGFAWLENMQKYGRLADPINNKDLRAKGGNPCLEQTLESYELCCLVETFPDRHESLDDFKKTLECAFLYAKTVTLGQTHWKEVNEILLRNRRIGCSMSGIAQFLTSRGLGVLKEWSEEGYAHIQKCDREISEQFKIPLSIKTTSIKPSGTVSLLAGATPGMHYPKSRFYIRRVRVSASSELLGPLRRAGYHVEQAVGQEDTMVVEIPVDCGEGIRTLEEVGMWEQLSLAAFLQKYWADNQVSCTVTFNPVTEGSQLEAALEYFQYQLKGVSFLPLLEDGAFPQMPYETISEKEYKTRMVRFLLILTA